MSYSLTINDSITTLQTLNDFDRDIQNLKDFLEDELLTEEATDRLKSIISLMTIKNSNTKNNVHKTMNALNRMNMY